MKERSATAKSLRRIIILLLAFAIGIYLGVMLVFQSAEDSSSNNQPAEPIEAERRNH